MSTALNHVETDAPRVVATVTNADSLFGAVIRAVKSGADPDHMERMIALYERVKANEAKAAFQAAMAVTQAEIGPVARDRVNTHTKSAYATLEAVDDAIRPVYTKHGFSLTFDSDQDDKSLTIFCDVMHDVGHRERRVLKGALDTVGPNGSRNKTDIQGLGSTTSYLRRYLTCMVFNVAVRNQDVDGNAGRSGPSGYITDAQADELKALLVETGLEIGKFLDWLKAPSLSDIPARDFDRACAALLKRRAS